MVRSIEMKLSGVAMLVPRNFWVGCTTAQSLQGKPWPASRPLALKCDNFGFFDATGSCHTSQTEVCTWIFDLGPRCGVAGVERRWEGVKKIRGF